MKKNNIFQKINDWNSQPFSEMKKKISFLHKDSLVVASLFLVSSKSNFTAKKNSHDAFFRVLGVVIRS